MCHIAFRLCKKSVSILFIRSLQALEGHIEVSHNLLFSRLNKSCSLSLSSKERSLWHPPEPLQQLHIFLVLRAPDTVLQMGPHECRAEGDNLSLPAGCPSFDATQDAVGLPGCKCLLLASVKLFAHHTPKSSLGLLSMSSSASLYAYVGLSLLKCNTLQLALLNLIRFTWFHFSGLSRSLWMASLSSIVSTGPFSLVSSANLLKGHLIPLCHRQRC